MKKGTKTDSSVVQQSVDEVVDRLLLAVDTDGDGNINIHTRNIKFNFIIFALLSYLFIYFIPQVISTWKSL